MAAKKKRRTVRKSKTRKPKARKRKAKRKGKGTAPLAILKKRLVKLSKIVKSRGG